MSTATESQLIAPHGGELVDRTGERPDDLDSLEVVRLTPRELADLDMLASGALSPLAGAIDQLPAVWLNPTGLGDCHCDVAHAATSARVRPSCSSLSRTIRADSAGGCSSVSIFNSGSLGSSYGSETPVNSLISPLNAFS